MKGIKDNDKGWRNIKRQFNPPKDTHGVVGILASEADRDDEFDNVSIGTVHEFGLPERGIPERSFIRATIDAGVMKYRRLSKTLMQRELQVPHTASLKNALRLLGEKLRADIIAHINKGIEPENAPETIARKGSSKPLIDTAQMKQSINYEIRDGK